MAQEKEEQKKLLIEVMQADEKDGVYKAGNMAQQTAVEWLEDNLIGNPHTENDFMHNRNVFEQAKQMEKEQSMDLIKQTAMFMGALNFDKEIASMTYEDVYNSYYNK